MLANAKKVAQISQGFFSTLVLITTGAVLCCCPEKDFQATGRVLLNGDTVDMTYKYFCAMHPFPWSLHPDNFEENSLLHEGLMDRLFKKMDATYRQ